MQQNNIVIRSEVSEVQFGLYSDADIRHLSCCQISSPIAFDGLGNAINNGLYDPKLGPTTQYGPPCVTCGLIYMNCPGHSGHIELCVPVYHPLLFAKMFAILRAQCANCHKFRISESKIRIALIKLKLIEMGMEKESQDIEDLFIPPAIFDDSGTATDASSHLDSVNQQLEIYEQKYQKFLQQRTSKPSSRTMALQRDVLDAFQKTSIAAKKCESCGGFSPPLRKDGYTKLFEKPLQKKHRKSMQGMKLKLKPALQKLHNPRESIDGDDSDDEVPSEDEGESKFSDTDKYLAPIEVEARVKLLWQAHPDFLDFIWHRAALSNTLISQPSSSSELWRTFFIRAVLVPPSRFRPPADLGDVQSEHPQNLSLSKILSINEKIDKIRTMTSDSAGASEESAKSIDISKLIGVWIDLQNAVNCFIDSTKDQNVRPDDAVSGIRQILEKKEGLFRRHMMGKRVNYCCRSVISPDPFLGMNEIGIPVQFAKELHYPTPVTSWNVKMLRQMVENGPSIYPGANQIEKSDGSIIKLDKFSQQERVAKAKLLLSDPGIKVYRHLISGDVLLVNRQPTLHKPGIMAHKARVLQHVREQTLRMNYANCNAYNADFDGDEMNCHFVQNEIARAEATYICNTDNQYIVPTSGAPLRGLIQDHVASGVKLTCKDTFLTLEEFQQLLYIAVTGLPGTEVVNNFEEITIPPPTVLKPVRLWTGKQVITALLRLLCRPPLPQLHLDAKSRTPPTAFGVSEQEHVVIFRFGELLSGVLDKNAIGNSALGIVHAIYELYGSELAGLILSAFSRLFTYHLQNAGHTCGIEDLTLTEASDKVRAKLLTKVQTDSEIGLQKFLDSAAGVAPTALSGSNGFTPSERLRCENRIAHLLHSEKTEGKVKLDGAVQAVVNKSASDILKACLPSGLEVQFPKNNFSMMVLTGAKGSAVNQSQISCFLGQQALEGQRVPMMISGKTLPSFKPYDSRIRAGGFITDRFLTGVRPQEYYFHCMAGREGLVDTAVKTSRSGYLQRCLVKHLEELRVNYDLTVRDSAGSVVQFLYGEDGLDPMSAGLLSGKSNELLFLSRNHQALVHKYSVHQNYFEQGLEMESAKLHHQQYSAAKSTLESHSGSNSAKVKFSKRDFILARRKQHQDRPWSRYNMKKKWFLAEIVKVRKPSSSRSSTPHLPYLSYDIRYVDDNVVEKRVPANMRIKATPLVVNNGELQPEHNALIPLLKPGLPDPVMSVLGVSNNVGAVSENMQQKIKEYVAKNPDGVISGDTTETTVTGDGLELLVWIKYLRSLACPGEAVGCVAAQSVGEPSTQMTLNTFHLAGHGGANVTLGIPRLREIIMTASKTLKTPTMMIPLAKGQTNETAKLLALRFSRVPLSKLLHHTLGIEVGEKIVRDKIRGVWERMYRVRFHFENPRIIQSCFGVSFEQLIDVVKTTVIKKLHAIITLELRRAKASSKQTVVIKNTTSASRFSQAKSTEDGGEDEEKGESKAKQSDPDGVDSDAEDNDDIDDVDDVEQGTLKLGQRGEVTGYEDDDSDEEETGSVTGGGMLDTEALEMEEVDSDSLSELDDSEPSTATALDAVEDALKRLQASVHTKTARANAAPASKEKQSTKRDTPKELVGRVGNGRIVDVGGTLASSEAEGWVELNMAFPAHSRKLLMVQLAEQACAKASVRETKSIANAYPSECEIDGEKRFAVQTEGVNFEAAWDLPEVLADVNHIKSNDIWRVLCTYGVEAARQSIVSEITGVFGVYGINVNPRHLSLIADFMTRNGFYVPMNRMAMMECPSRFLQMSFETTATFLTQAALEGGVETLESPSARIVTGGVPRVGTGCFDVMLPL